MVGITPPTSIALKELYDAVLKSGLNLPLLSPDEWRRDEREGKKTTFLGLVSTSGSGVHVAFQIMSRKKRRGYVRHDSSDWSAHQPKDLTPEQNWKCEIPVLAKVGSVFASRTVKKISSMLYQKTARGRG